MSHFTVFGAMPALVDIDQNELAFTAWLWIKYKMIYWRIFTQPLETDNFHVLSIQNVGMWIMVCALENFFHSDFTIFLNNNNSQRG